MILLHASRSVRTSWLLVCRTLRWGLQAPAPRTIVRHSAPAGRVARQFIGVREPGVRLKSIAEKFPAAAMPAGVGLIRGCSPRTDRLELGLLLVAQRCVEIVKHRTHQLDRLQHGIEPLAAGGDPPRFRPPILALS